MQVVIFKLNNEQFAVETDKIQSINDAMEITRVPKAPAHIKGLINLRGNIISLLDINLLLDIPKGDKSQNNIIILEMEDELVGIAVDDVYEVLDVEENLIERSSDERRKEYIEGIINFQDRIVTLIDIDKLL
ncbi:chemotaxis protein CheW [Clostridium botulinum]|uniref:Positive regulator of CheA protein activity (CheW) n=1 Tax=Clostridium botulinum CFSAN001627 TaxID=1232189 RepID=M1ZSJ0_CLOBO|nr:chemotaxis protein CheW [Clostridium botulinum]EKN37730.1 positive regulator of CheA protein activity (CheW) [Clostridium botulinum CFSAN001627]APC82947.1 cheW-like domain protein [Clostridium botulinum]AXG97602.1 chemotaxis protein CheW [Clostridium botulinum]EDT80258.1 putative chemotaxis protein CheW [Clostridium botulinum NCTC 2916]MBY6771196.1 purine-binding chemotaxis protein CheW [Clostridium botulinum]